MITESNTPRTDAAILTGSNRLDQGEYVKAEFAQKLERELAQALTPPADTAIEPSDLVAAGDDMLKAMITLQGLMNCEFGEYGPCKKCLKANHEANTAAEAWEEAKSESAKGQP